MRHSNKYYMKVKKINMIKNYYYYIKKVKNKKLKIGLEPFLFLFLFDNSVITMRERRCQLNNKALGNLSLFLVVRNTKIFLWKTSNKNWNCRVNENSKNPRNERTLRLNMPDAARSNQIRTSVVNISTLPYLIRAPQST